MARPRIDDSPASRLWKDALSMWIRYCGVSDEIKTLRNKWSFILTSRAAYWPLPDIEGTVFQRLITLDSSIQTEFERIGFSRYTLETSAAFINATKKWSMQDLLQCLDILGDMFGELEEYLGKLKLVFFQRTSSLEIPHYSGLPRSPQRTIGDEMLHQVADNVTSSYLNCLDWSSDLTWDGFVSFVYPEREVFRGGVFRVMPYTKLFHLEMSEDGKYFPGAFLLLAHETSHATMYKVVEGSPKHCQWVLAMWRRFFDRLESTERLTQNAFGHDVCRGCGNLAFIQRLYSQVEGGKIFRQCVADILGLEIGGICSLLSLIDFAPFLETLFRAAFAAGYYHETEEPKTEILTEVDNLYNTLLIEKEKECPKSSPQLCLDYLLQLGLSTGAAFHHDDSAMILDALPSLFEPQLNKRPPFFDRKTLCSNFFDLPCKSNSCAKGSPSVISHLIKDPFRYSFDSNLADALVGDTCVEANVDPRLVLHVFYKLYRMKRLGSYSATVHSLAFAKARSTPHRRERAGSE
jgi:hypothetical protein